MSSQYLFKFNTENLEMEIDLAEDQKISISVLDFENNDYIAKDNLLKFNNIWNNSDLEYRFFENQIKEFIYLNDFNSPRKFNFIIKGFEKTLIKDGDILFLNKENNLIYTIKKPFIIKDENIYDYNEVITHTFNPNTNIYSIILGNCKESLFPLIIDPNFVFPSSKYGEGEVYGGLSKGHTVIVGTDSSNTPLDFSNKIINKDMPDQLLGSDLITFNKNVNVYFDLFKKVEEENLNINSITVAGSDKLRKIYTKNSSTTIDNLEISLSAILINIDKNAPASSYNIYYTFGNLPESTISVTHSVLLVDNPYATNNLDSEIYGKVSIPENDSNNIYRYNFTYTPPTNLTELDHVLIKIENIIEYTIGDRELKTTKTSFILLQFVSNLHKENFSFTENSAKVDFINADLYLPTSNRGLVIVDSSLGLVRIIDDNSGLPLSALNIKCANRIGTDSDPKGLLVCSNDGIFYYCEKPIGDPTSSDSTQRPDFSLNPYAEPASYIKPIKVSKLKIVDFVMSGIFLFLLTNEGKILRFTYKTFLFNLINKPLNIDDNNISVDGEYIDLSGINDVYIADNDDNINVFSESNFFDVKTSTQYPSPYAPDSDNLPVKLLPISVNSDNQFLGLQSAMESAYFQKNTKKLHGITVIYNQSSIGDE